MGMVGMFFCGDAVSGFVGWRRGGGAGLDRGVAMLQQVAVHDFAVERLNPCGLLSERGGLGRTHLRWYLSCRASVKEEGL